MSAILRPDFPNAPLHPYCNVCGWRKGGRDSWDGIKCKCGLSAPAITRVNSDAPVRTGADPAPAATPPSPPAGADLPAHLRPACPHCDGTGMARGYLCVPCDGWGYAS